MRNSTSIINNNYLETCENHGIYNVFFVWYNFVEIYLVTARCAE